MVMGLDTVRCKLEYAGPPINNSEGFKIIAGLTLAKYGQKTSGFMFSNWKCIFKVVFQFKVEGFIAVRGLCCSNAIN